MDKLESSISRPKRVLKLSFSQRFFRGLWDQNSIIPEDTLNMVAAATSLAMLFVGSLLFSPIVGILVAPSGFIFGPRLWVKWHRRKIRLAFEKNIPRITKALVSATKGSKTPLEAFRYAAEQAPNIIKPELDMVVEKAEMKIPLERAVKEMAERLQLPEANILAFAVGMLIELGGNPVDLYEAAGEFAKYKQKKREVIDTNTKRIRTQGLFANVGLAALFYLVAFTTKGEFYEMLINPRGKAMLFVAFLLQAFSIFVVNRICKQVGETKINTL